MKLSELMSSLGLWIYPVVGLLGFVTAFTVVLIRVAKTGKAEMASNGEIPFHDGTDEEGGAA